MPDDMTTAEREAYELGRADAEAAASWAADGNTPADHARRVLAMLADGDPAAWDYLPEPPNLSGEYADGPTPMSLKRGLEVIGDATPENLAALCDAYEAGVADHFGPACERELRAALPAGCTGCHNDDGSISHDGDTCPVHEAD